MSVRVGHLGLGSNVGDRRANLQAAVDGLGGHDVTVLASSSTYDTDPVGEITRPADVPQCLPARRRQRSPPRSCSTRARRSSASSAVSPAGPPRPAPDRRRRAPAGRPRARLAAPAHPARAGPRAALRADPAARARLRARHARRASAWPMRSPRCRSTRAFAARARRSRRRDNQRVLLVVDVGNTQTHFGAVRDGAIVEQWRLTTDRSSTPDELAATLRSDARAAGPGLRGPRRLGALLDRAEARARVGAGDAPLPGARVADRRARRAHRHADPPREPARARPRPPRQRGRGVDAPAGSVHRRGLRHRDHLRRGLSARASTSAGSSPRASRSPSRRSRSAPPACGTSRSPSRGR